MVPKKRITKYLKPNVIKTVSVIKNNIVRPNTSNITNQKMNSSRDGNVQNQLLNFPKNNKSRVFIVGGGSSLSNFDFSLIENEDVIAVNKAIEYVKHATYFITMDYSFIRDRSKLTNADFGIIKQKADTSYFVINTEHPYIRNINGVYVDTRMNLKYSALSEFTGVIKSNKTYDISNGFGNDINSFTHGQNSGYCALQLAINLGYDEIYLLGFDLNINSQKTHFHNGYKQDISKFSKNLINYRAIFAKSIQLNKMKNKIFSCSSVSYLNNFIKYVDINTILKKSVEEPKIEKIEMITSINKNDLRNLIVIGYYTENTPYEQEAQGLINSCKKLNLKQDIIGIPTFGSWQSNTRFKARFMLAMLKKYPGFNLVYVDVDAVIHSRPELFANHNCDISVRYQDFRWRKNECLSGTIFIQSNERTIRLCERWNEINESEGTNPKTLEQWNLDKAIQESIKNDNLIFKNLPAEYCFIFDSMKAIYPNAKPVIEHYQASRRFRNKV